LKKRWQGKIDTRDFVSAKSKEFDRLLSGFREKMNSEVERSSSEWNKNLGSLRSELLTAKKETLVGGVDHDRVFRQALAVEVVKQSAHVVVHAPDATQVVLDVELVCPLAQRIAFEAGWLFTAE
jgi:hypothetical protein